MSQSSPDSTSAQGRDDSVHAEPATVRMANDIARQLGAALPTDQAVTAIADHFQHFWNPRLLGELDRAIAAGNVEVNPLAIAAAEALADVGT